MVIARDLLYGGDTWTSKVYVFYGGSPFDTIPDLAIIRPEATGFHIAICVGGVKGGGYSDLIVGAYRAAPMPGGYMMGQVYIYYDGPNFDTIPDVILNGERVVIMNASVTQSAAMSTTIDLKM